MTDVNHRIAVIVALVVIVAALGAGSARAQRGPADAVPVRGDPGAPQPAPSVSASPQPVDARTVANVAPAAAASAARDAAGSQPVPYRTLNPSGYAAAQAAASHGRGSPPAAAPAPGASIGAAATPTLLNTFEGQSENGWYPPDTNIAAGPNQVVEVTNSQWIVYNKDGSVARPNVTFRTWFPYAWLPSDDFFYPKALYRDGHFYIVTMYLDIPNQLSYLLVSASRTDQATGQWCNFTYNATLGTGNDLSYSDFPGVGITGNALYVFTNLWRFSDSSANGNLSFFIDKSKLDSCTVNNARRFGSFRNSDNALAFSLQPVTDYDAAGNAAEYVINTFSVDSGPANQVSIWRITDALGAVIFNRWTLTTKSFSIPPVAAQPGSATGLDEGDARLTHAVKRYNTIWTAHTVALSCGAGGSGSTIHWMAFNAPASTDRLVGPSLQQDGYYDDGCGSYLFYPDITPDGAGNAVMSFVRSSATEPVNLRVTGRFIQDPLSQMVSPSVLVFQGPSGVTETRCGSQNCTGPGRFGDYSGISLDPADQTRVWVANEYVKGNNAWGTRIGAVTMGPFTPPGF